jgi:voltage-gated sodium channel
VIVANAAVLGARTYDELEREHGDLLELLNDVFLVVFLVELALRIASHGRRPLGFFRDGWNVFDFVVILAAFAPGVRESSTLLRIARVLRVVRVVRLLPDLRVFTLAIVRSLPPFASLTVLTGVILFLYGMVGWVLFGDEDPTHWGDIGQAMLTLFVLLTLENFPAYLERGMDIHPWSVVYFVSFVLVAAFVVLNVLIGVVLHSMEEAREIHAREALRARGVDATREEAHVFERLRQARAALDELERDLALARDREARPPPDAERARAPAPETTS